MLKTDLALPIELLTLSSVQAESLYKTKTFLKVKVPFFAVCQHWFNLHVLQWVISPTVVNLTADGGVW